MSRKRNNTTNGEASTSSGAAEADLEQEVMIEKPKGEKGDLLETTALTSPMPPTMTGIPIPTISIPQPDMTVEELVEAATEEPSSVFGAEQLRILAQLQRDDLPEYEKVRANLKEHGVRVSYLDKQVSKLNVLKSDLDDPQVEVIYRLGSSAELLRTPNNTKWADIVVNGHRETHLITSTGFKRWLRRQFKRKTDTVARSSAIDEAIRQLDAEDELPEFKVYVRVAPGTDGKIYVDLADQTWKAIEIDAEGWRIVSDPPVRFRRPDGMLPLPVPVTGGTLDEVFNFINIADPIDRVLVMSWAVASFDVVSPQPLLFLRGRKGSAKSTVTRFLGQLLDPSSLKSRMLPREDKDFFIAADKRHILCFDNASAILDQTSDILCQLITGGGFGTRGLYTNGEEFQIEAMGSVIINGIENVVTRPDLADRTIAINLPVIQETERRTEQEYWGAFAESHPRMLGLVLDGVVTALRQLPTVNETSYPRMADFAKFGTAGETAYWPPGTFMSAYHMNIAGVVDDTLEADPVSMALMAFMENETECSATADEWLKKLVTKKDAAKADKFPKNGRALSSRFSRAEPFLQEKGLIMSTYREDNYMRTRKITFKRIAKAAIAAVAASE